MAYKLLSQSRKLNKRGGPNKSAGGVGARRLEKVLKKISGGGSTFRHLLGNREECVSVFL